jgi:hypothetical protein
MGWGHSPKTPPKEKAIKRLEELKKEKESEVK